MMVMVMMMAGLIVRAAVFAVIVVYNGQDV
jgi:hypothetical protein